jgi:peroxiredoxin
MAGADRTGRGASAPERSPEDAARALGPRYGRYAALLAIVLLVLVTVNTIVTKPHGVGGIPPGGRLAPFAAPLVTSNLPGDADVATERNQGSAGRVPACQLRGPQILNICALYEHNPVVLAFFVEGSSCTGILGEMQGLEAAFGGVRFAAVALGGNRTSLRRLVRRLHLTFPVAIDRDGAVATLYKVASCPQVTFSHAGGVVASRALVTTPTPATLRGRVAALAASSAGGA